MKAFMLFLLLIGTSFSQDQTPPEKVDGGNDETLIDESENPDEVEVGEEKKSIQRSEECQCPEVQEENEAGQLNFPAGSVFLISPVPQEAQPQKEEPKIVPYPEAPNPSGYTSDQYKFIP